MPAALWNSEKETWHECSVQSNSFGLDRTRSLKATQALHLTCIHYHFMYTQTDSHTVCQCSTVGPSPACRCQSSVLAGRKEGFMPDGCLICQLNGTKPSPVAVALEPSLTTHCMPLLCREVHNTMHCGVTVVLISFWTESVISAAATPWAGWQVLSV